MLLSCDRGLTLVDVLIGLKLFIAVFRVVHDIKCKGIDWKVGKEEPPIHLKLLKGIPGLINNDKSLFVTVECFISEGFPDDPGNVTRVNNSGISCPML